MSSFGNLRSILNKVQKNEHTAAITNIYRPQLFFSSSCGNKEVGNTWKAGRTSASDVKTFSTVAETSYENEISHDLNSFEHQPKEQDVGYLNRILNARVYEAAIETELQYANNLSVVSVLLQLRNCVSPHFRHCQIKVMRHLRFFCSSPRY